MPYIKQQDRIKFTHAIAEALGVMKDGTDNFYVKGEYFGYFVNRCVKRFLADPEYTQNAFNSAFFNNAKQKSLANAADSVAAMINRSDPIAGAGELNFALTTIMWGFLGQAEGFPEIGYGIRAYLEGILDKIRQSLETVNNGSQKDATMAFRRHLVIRGVLSHMSAETYRQLTSAYEDKKEAENGGIWKDGHLNLTTEN
jgi:hypothetical protein